MEDKEKFDAGDEREQQASGDEVEGHKFETDEREQHASGDDVEGHKWEAGEGQVSTGE